MKSSLWPKFRDFSLGGFCFFFLNETLVTCLAVHTIQLRHEKTKTNSSFSSRLDNIKEIGSFQHSGVFKKMSVLMHPLFKHLQFVWWRFQEEISSFQSSTAGNISKQQYVTCHGWTVFFNHYRSPCKILCWVPTKAYVCNWRKLMRNKWNNIWIFHNQLSQK